MLDIPSDSSLSADIATRALCHSVNRVTDEVMGLLAHPALQRSNRRRHRSQVRQISMYLCHVVLGLPQNEVALAFGYDRSTVSYACHVIEDRRDNKALDELLIGLERIVSAMSSVAKGYRYE
ncbi:transposase [Allorhizobium sp. BGMRC 0089]|uniref:helix-turn-helix domain-containing protein n=1 Tax=Allorhizobium sonneratiae TaxID=2934936 RepID=UPI0020342700|nr:helix-turn-helix domain-containing protein [Allorhizobium sonneratiae]MCM2293468.1 transposase [Allorhizobium sonneratiae]